jgi:hypothetical protein
MNNKPASKDEPAFILNSLKDNIEEIDKNTKA